jgi:hypothetical protein
MSETVVTSPLCASLVADQNRLAFLPAFFGPRLMMRGESLVYTWLDQLCPGYSGGYWHYYKLSNGGFYMAPSVGTPLRLECEGNGFEGEFSADAAGIVATLFALSDLMTLSSDERIIWLYYLLKDYACEHADAGLICQAID